jgi:hypothetical protein
LDLEYYSPFGPCDCITLPDDCLPGQVYCGTSFYGSVVDSTLDLDLSLNLGAEVCDVDNSFYTCVGDEEGPVQCLDIDLTYSDTRVINECIGCKDPFAENYCNTCPYSDFSCFYSQQVTSGNNPVPGSCDVDGDGELTVLDIVMTVNYILGNVEFNQQQIEAADINSDGVVDVLDVLSCINNMLQFSTSQDNNLLKTIATTLQRPGGLKNTMRVFQSNGYTIRRLKDHMRKSNFSGYNMGSKMVRQQNHIRKSQKVERNLTRARENLNTLRNRRR